MLPSFVMLFAMIALMSICRFASGYCNFEVISRVSSGRKVTLLNAGSDAPPLDDRTRERIDNLVKSNKVLLFMKGNKLFPQW